MKKQEKTNVMRILDQKKRSYQPHCYANSDAISGPEVAQVLGQDPARVFKTLVTVGHSKGHYVFVIPVCRELDLKKAAKAVGEKSIEMIRSKDLLPLTGYIHGGCSPIGMKNFFPPPSTAQRRILIPSASVLERSAIRWSFPSSIWKLSSPSPSLTFAYKNDRACNSTPDFHSRSEAKCV